MSSINFTHTPTKANATIPRPFTYTSENGYQIDGMYDFEYENTTFEEWNLTKFTFKHWYGLNVTKEIANYSENAEIPYYLKLTFITCFIVILCVGVIGNVMVPIVILKTKDMRNSTNIFLVNLSVADLMFLLICVPPAILEVNSKLETWLLGKELCLAIPFLEQIVAHVSVLTILALSFERYYAICHPFKAGYICTKTRAAVICGLVWFIAVLLTSPLLISTTFFYENYNDGSEIAVCVTTSNTLWLTWFFILTNVVFFIVPLGVLVVLYSFIATNLMKTSIIIAQNNNSTNNSNNVTKYRKQVILMLGTVILAFFVCFLPFKLLQLSSIVIERDEIETLLAKNGFNMEELVYFCREMVYFHSAINPILYNLISAKFRKGFVKLLRINKLKCNGNIRADIHSRDNLNIVTTTEF